MRIHTPVTILLIASLTLTACSSNRSQAMQIGRTGEEWACRPNAQADAWECVQDDALAATIARERSLPSPAGQ